MGLTIVIPVGPQPEYQEYIEECFDSVSAQMENGDEIIFVTDGFVSSPFDHTEKLYGLGRYYTPDRYVRVREYAVPWRVGCADAWNIGVGLSNNEWCLLMGSDDKLLPGCLDTARDVLIDNEPDPLGYYNLTVETSSGNMIALHNNAAFVSKTLWEYTGGFPPSAGAGAPDALIISIMLKHMPQHLHQIDEHTPLYWVREHNAQDTLRQAAFLSKEVIAIRGKETERFNPKKEN